MAAPPVAITRSVSSDCISALVALSVGSARIWIASAGAPASRAVFSRKRAASAVQASAAGCGLNTMALRVISASIALK